MSVFVLGSDNRPVMPCSEKRARLLLTKGRAYVVKMYPFTIKLKDRSVDDCELQNIEVKIDPGSKTTGLCISRTVEKTVNVLNLFELEHKGQLISKKLKTRAMLRRVRRNRNTRYRQPRFDNRTRKSGWLPPSLQHRVDAILSWVKRFQRYLPVVSIAVERVKFDMQKMRNPEISGIEYQQGTLFQYEVIEYLLEKFNRQCAYCGAMDCKLEKEHIIAKANGGTNAISNLAIACIPCNRAKSNLPIEIFLANKPEVLKRIKAQLKTPLKDAAAVNATRNKLFSELLKTGLPIAIGTGAKTKYNRIKLSVPKTHALDAACVGDIENIIGWNRPHIAIKCNGRGSYSRTRLDKYGFPRIYFTRLKTAFGFQTGDMVKVISRFKDNFKSVIGRIMIKQNGYFKLTLGKESIQPKWNLCKLIQKADGYSYSKKDYTFYYINNHLLTVG